MNKKKIILLIAFALAYFTGSAQVLSEPYRLFPKANFAPPKDTIVAAVRLNEIRSVIADTSLYTWNGIFWRKLASGSVLGLPENIYNTNGALTSNRTVTMNAFTLSFEKDLFINGVRVGIGNNGYNANTVFGLNSGGLMTDGNANSLFGRDAGRYITSGYYNSYFGWLSGLGTSTGYENVGVGPQTIADNPAGHGNTALGFQSHKEGGSVDLNSSFGTQAGFITSPGGDGNTNMGAFSGLYGRSGAYNVRIGYFAGASEYGTPPYPHSPSYSIYLGHQAGRYDTMDNRLMIENSASNTPLIDGNFAADTLRFNGGVSVRDIAINNASTRVVVWDSATGKFASVMKSNLVSTGGGGGGTYTSSNGITLTTFNFKLGGTLTEPTTIATGGNSLTISSTTTTPLYVSSGGSNAVAQFTSSAASGTGIVAMANNVPLWVINTQTANNTGLANAGVYNRSGSGGVGGGLRSQFNYNLSNGSGVALGSYSFSWTNATSGSESAEYSLNLSSGPGTSATRMTLYGGTGRMRLHAYGQGALGGTPTYLVGVDASGLLVETAASSIGAFTEKTNLGTATNWIAANDNTSSQLLNEMLKVGSSTDNNHRTITINAVLFVPTSSFIGTGQWVQCGLISNAAYRPSHSVYFPGVEVIDATRFKNSGGTQFAGTASYGSVSLRIDSNGQVFVYISSITSNATLSGVSQVIIPIVVTYFITPTL